MKKSIPKVRERESEASILGNDREREFPLTPVRLPIGKLPCCVVFSCMLTKQLCWEINNPFLALFSNPPLPSFSLLLDDSTIYVGDIPLSTISRFFFASLPYVCRYHCCIFIPSCQSQLLLWTVTIMIVMMMAIQNFEWK